MEKHVLKIQISSGSPASFFKGPKLQSLRTPSFNGKGGSSANIELIGWAAQELSSPLFVESPSQKNASVGRGKENEAGTLPSLLQPRLNQKFSDHRRTHTDAHRDAHHLLRFLFSSSRSLCVPSRTVPRLDVERFFCHRPRLVGGLDADDTPKTNAPVRRRGKGTRKTEF